MPAPPKYANSGSRKKCPNALILHSLGIRQDLGFGGWGIALCGFRFKDLGLSVWT